MRGRKSTKDDDLERAAELLSVTLPIVRRKMLRDLFKTGQDQFGEETALHHMMIMKVLAESGGGSNPTEIGEILGISKPQMTHLIDQLIFVETVRRQHDAEDRRKINIRLTEKGKTTLEHAERLLKDRLKARLSSLGEGDLRELADSLGNMAKILSKMQ